MSSQQQEEQTQDPYTILNIPIDADYSQIKEKFYLYSRIFHPDKQSSHLYKESRSQFEEIDKAYKAISSPFLKLIYDNFGYSGIQIYTEHPNKFIDLEQQYTQTYEQKANHKHEYKLRIQILKQKLYNYDQFKTKYLKKNKKIQLIFWLVRKHINSKSVYFLQKYSYSQYNE